MATFVLVHGAMHGGWCWRGVNAELRRRGHELHSPTLTGQGERRSSLSRDVGLETHVRDITELLWFEDLHDVVLVMHSYAGVLAGPVAERAADRLAGVVFLGAFVTRPGQCLLDVEPAEVGERYRALARDEGDGWLVRARPTFLSQWGLPPELHRFVKPRLTDFPFRCQTDPATYDPAALASLPCVYVWHTAPPLTSLEQSRAAAFEHGWVVTEIAAGHDMMLAAPQETSELLEDIWSNLSGGG